MILTCPECATSYFVDDLRIPRLGRMVKCTTCGHRWRAHQDRKEPETERPPEEMVDGAPPPPVEDDIEFVAPLEPVRKKAEPKKKPRGVMIAVSGALVVLALAGGAAVLLRQQIAGMFPGAAPLFSAIGLPVNTIGLVLEAKATATMQAGRPVWSVTGSVRNVREEAIVSPPIRLTLLDEEGNELATMLAQTENGRVPPGATRYFAITVPDPPAGGAKMAVELEVAHAGETPAHKAELTRAPGAAHPAEPMEAQPLPADSPDALEKHEQP